MTELRQSLRSLLKRPGLTATAVLTLALGLGASTAIFSLLDTVALRPLPYRDADRLVEIGTVIPGQKEFRGVSWPRFQALLGEGRTMTAATAYYTSTFGLTERERPEELSGARVSSGFFDVWGVAPTLGRTFSADEEKRGGRDVVLLSAGFWRQRFGGDRAVLGRNLELEGRPTTIVGVLPDVLRFPFSDVQIWLPRPDDASFVSRKAQALGAGYLQVVARLKPGVPLAAVERDLERISASYRANLPGQIDGALALGVVTLDEHLVGTTRATLLVLLAAVSLVLLIACADVANLLLADGLSRRREIAARIALGAGRRHILGQALRESLLLAGAGGLLGVLLAYLGLKLLVAANPADLPRIGEVALSGRALAFAFLLTTAAGVLAGLAPAWQTLRTDPRSFLAERGGTGGIGGTGGNPGGLGQGLLVTLEIALALMLFSAAGLLLRSLAQVNGMDLGLVPKNLMFVDVTLPAARYPGATERRIFFEELVERLRGLPGVSAAALVEHPPTVGASHMRLSVEGQAPVATDRQPLVTRLITGAGYFHALETRFLAGHDFDPGIAPNAPLTGILGRSFRDTYFRGQNPVGRHLRLGTVTVEIVGVVEDIQQNPLEADREPLVFLFHHQVGAELSPPDSMSLALRSALPAASVAASVRRVVHGLDPGEPLPEMTTLASLLRAATARRRLTTGLFAGFSALALLLCILGIYGVVAHSISLRRREIGVRMALGARPGQVLLSVLRRGARSIVPGLALGALASYFAGRALQSQLFEVPATDLLHFTATAVILGAVAFLACLVPGQQATRIDPAATLRTP
jgi:predicted permease